MADTPTDYEAESDIRILRIADEIKNDAARMGRLRAHAAKVAREMQEVAGEEVKDDMAKGFRRIG